MTEMSAIIIGYVGVTITLFLTAMHDNMWLYPCVTSTSLSIGTRLVNGCIFIIALTLLSVIGVCFAELLSFIVARYFLTEGIQPDESALLGAIATALCWLIGFTVFVQIMVRQNRREREVETAINTAAHPSPGEDGLGDGYGSMIYTRSNVRHDTAEETLLSHGHNGDDDIEDLSSWNIVTKCLYFSLDKIMYLPTCTIGITRIFASYQIIASTFLASILIYLTTVFSAFIPALKGCFETINKTLLLYMVIFCFAIILTIRLILELI